MQPIPDPASTPSIPAESNQAPEPVFNAPWEATAFAIVTHLATLEHYTWPEWTQYLSSAIAITENASTDSVPYYEQWVMACEQLLVDKGLLDSQAIDQKMHELVTEREAEHNH